jgi:hypothetical protein
MASSMEVEDGPPFWPKITATIVATMCCGRRRTSALGRRSIDPPKTTTPGSSSSSLPPRWLKGGTKAAPPRSKEQQKSFIEGGGGEGVVDLWELCHRPPPAPSVGAPSELHEQQQCHHKPHGTEQLKLHHRQTPKSITPYSTWVMLKTRVYLALNLPRRVSLTNFGWLFKRRRPWIGPVGCGELPSYCSGLRESRGRSEWCLTTAHTLTDSAMFVEAIPMYRLPSCKRS